MLSYDYDLGVIGGGSAGLTVAAGAAQLGVKVLLVDKESRLGGDCLHYGCVPSKTLIRTARVRHLMNKAHEFGLPPVKLPPVDYSKVADHISAVISEIQKHDSVARFNSLGVDVKFGSPSFIDPKSVLLDGKTVSARSWVIATGSSPSAPPIPGLKDVPYLTNMNIFSLQDLPSSLLVLGGGPIAIEMAQAFQRLGCKVTVIQRSNHILSKEDPDMSQYVMDGMIQDGVKFILGAKIEQVRERAGGIEVIWENSQEGAAGRNIVSGQKILVALGRKANLKSLNLDHIGIIHNSNGIDVDCRMRTSVKNIYAAGDVTGKYLFTHAAGYEGGIIVANAILHLPRKANYKWLPWCTYSDPELASVGLNESRAKGLEIKYSTVVEEFSGNDRALAEGEGCGRIKLLLDSKGRPLGVQIVAVHAGELLGEWVAAVNGSVGLATLAGAIHPYPTLTEINKKVAGKLLGEKIFSDRVRKILKILFSYRG